MGGDTNLSLHFRGKYVLSTRSWLQRTEEAVKILRIFLLFFCIAESGVAFLGTVKTPIQESCEGMTEKREKQQQQKTTIEAVFSEGKVPQKNFLHKDQKAQSS